MSLRDRLLVLAAPRSETLDVEGEKVVVREVGSLEFARYGELMGEDRTKGMAYLLQSCVFEEDGTTPVFDEETAQRIAPNARVTMPLVNKIMALSGFGKENKEGKEKHADAS